MVSCLLLVHSHARTLVLARSRKGGDGDPIDVGYKASDDGGRTWSALRSIVDNAGGNTYGNNVAVVVERASTIVDRSNYNSSARIRLDSNTGGAVKRHVGGGSTERVLLVFCVRTVRMAHRITHYRRQ